MQMTNMLIPQELEIDPELLALYQEMREADRSLSLFDRADRACREAAAALGVVYTTWADAGRNPQPRLKSKIASVCHREERYERRYYHQAA